MNNQIHNTYDKGENYHAESARYNPPRLALRNQNLPPNEIENTIPEQDLRNFRIVELEKNVRRLTDYLARQGNERSTIEGLLGLTEQAHSFSGSGGSED